MLVCNCIGREIICELVLFNEEFFVIYCYLLISVFLFMGDDDGLDNLFGLFIK